jgi:hypothetical protein
LEVLLPVYVVVIALVRDVVVVVVWVAGLHGMRGLDVWAILAKAMNEVIVIEAEMTGKPDLHMFIGSHVLVPLVHSSALQIIIYLLIVSVDPLPLIPTCIFVVVVLLFWKLDELSFFSVNRV